MKYDKIIARNHALKLDDNIPNTLSYKIKTFLGKKFGIWEFMDILPYSWKHYYWDNIKPIFKPQHQRLRKFIPKTWCDTTQMIVDLNFEMIKIFYEDEYLKGYVDWESDEQHKNFGSWLESAYQYITKEKPKLEDDMSNAYPKSNWKEMFEKIEVDGELHFTLKDDGIPYEVKYAEVIRLEKEIEDKNEKFLTEMIKYRHFFWT
jgi:hypothetical protein